MATELDTIPVGDLQSRYQIGRSQVYSRLQALGIVPEKYNGRSHINADQLASMDALHRHIQSGSAIIDFNPNRAERVSDSNSRKLSRQNGQIVPAKSGEMVSTAALNRIISAQLEDYETKEPDVDFANLRILDEAVNNRWWLSSSQMRKLLVLVTLPKSPFQRFGFQFKVVGRNGGEFAWQITKVEID